MTAEKAVAVVTNIPTPYRIPLFNEIHRQLGGKGRELWVIFAAATYGRRSWKTEWTGCRFRHVLLDSAVHEGRDGESAVFTYRGLGAALKNCRPAAVVTAGFSPATLRLWLRSWAGGAPYLIWSGETAVTKRSASPWRRLQRRLLLSRAAGCIAYGTAARKYLSSLGVKSDKITIAVNTVDTDFFRKETARIREKGRDADGKKRLLTVAQLTAGKRIDLLLGLMKELTVRRRDVVLDVVGDGPERPRLEDLAARLGLGEAVNFTGFRQRDELPAYLAAADCFLFPSSYDIWGLVVVEAMAAGVPCFCSPAAGVTADLIVDGETGFVEDFHDTAAAARRVEAFLEDRDGRAKMGRKAREAVAVRAPVEKSAAAFVRAVEGAIAGGRA